MGIDAGETEQPESSRVPVGPEFATLIRKGWRTMVMITNVLELAELFESPAYAAVIVTDGTGARGVYVTAQVAGGSLHEFAENGPAALAVQESVPVGL